MFLSSYVRKWLVKKEIYSLLTRRHQPTRKSSDIAEKLKVLFGKGCKIAATHPQIPRAAMELMTTYCEVEQVKSNPPQRDEILKAVKGAHAIFWGSFDKLGADVLDAAGPQLQAVSVRAAGTDHVNIPEIRKRKIHLGYTPVNSGAVAEIAIGLLICAARRIQEGRLSIITNTWKHYDFEFMLGRDIQNSVVGFFGFGNIGRQIAQRLSGFGIDQILYTDPVRAPEKFEQLYCATQVPFKDMITYSDIVFSCAPLLKETKNIFNKAAFETMKNSAVFINVGRGGTVNQNDLCDALKLNRIFAAGVDVTVPEPLPPNHRMMRVPNLVVSPHIGARTRQIRVLMSKTAAENILLSLAGEPMKYPKFKL